MKAFLRFHKKFIKQKRYLFEASIYEIKDLIKYPHGFRYGFICIDQLTGKKVIFDNHHPKGDHYHIDEIEFVYHFISISDLVDDFEREVSLHLGIKF